MIRANTLAKNFVMLFGGNVFGQSLFFLGFAYLARVLGPSEFGAWNFAQVFMLYLLRIGEFGLEVIGIKEVSRNPHSTSSWIATVVSLRFIFALLLFGFAVVISVAGLLPAGTQMLVVISALAVFPMALLLEWVFEARQEVGLISIGRVLKGFLFSIGVFLLVSSSEDAERAAFLYVGSLALPGLFIFSVVISRFGFDWPSIGIRKGLDALVQSAPVGVATLLSQYSLSLGTIVIGYLLSKEDLGFFTAAHRIVLFLWAYIITSMHRVLLPSLSRSFRESVDRFSGFIEKFFRLSALATIPIGILGTLSATSLMKILYSARYEPSGVVFGILLWGFVLASIRTILEIGLIASDRQKQYLKSVIFLSFVYTLLTPILILRAGIMGGAVAIASCEMIYLIFLMFTCPYSNPVSLLKNFWKPATAALVALGPMVFSNLQPLFKIPFGLIVFGTVMLILKGVTLEDFAIIKSLIQRKSLEQSA